LDYKSAEHHRAAAARARRLRGEATTRRVKEQLQDEIAQHEQIAEEIERASEPSPDDVDCVRKSYRQSAGLLDCDAAQETENETTMALLDDIVNGGNLATRLVVGALVGWPLIGPISRPAAKSLIKAGPIAYNRPNSSMPGRSKASAI
jgi:hypothetical protein